MMNKDSNAYLLIVARTGRSEDTKPRLSFSGSWLYDIGFLPGVLVQSIPVPGGMDFRLCDENIKSYRALLSETRRMGGALVSAYLATDCGRDVPAFVATGKRILSGGISIGDALVVGYSYGLIRARKASPEMFGFENLRAVTVSHIKSKHSGAPVPQVRLCGDWLSGIGFGQGAAVTADAEEGSLSLSLVDPGMDPARLVKYARENRLKIVQTAMDSHKKKGPRPAIGITGSLIARTGFMPGDMLAASYGYGEIRLQRLDFEKLGF